MSNNVGLCYPHIRIEMLLFVVYARLKANVSVGKDKAKQNNDTETLRKSTIGKWKQNAVYERLARTTRRCKKASLMVRNGCSQTRQ